MTLLSQSVILIHEGSNSLIYHRPTSEYGRPVVIKVLNTNSPTPHQLVCLNNEYEFTKDLAVDGVREAIAQIRIDDRPALVMEYVTGQPLEQAFVEQKQSLIDFIQVAIRVAQILGEVHQQHIIHRDINSYNVLVNLETKQVKIIDFGLASRIDLRVQHLGNPEWLDGTLAYISPEQTGRMNRVVDYRTDLYSLGVTFYELLTGQLPFESDDPLALVHAHIAKVPQPVTALNPDVPPMISNIVMKLLAKNAEDRYQSAFGLKADLERCLAAVTDLQGLENLEDLHFELGQDDYSGQLHIPQKLYGRAAEIAALLAAFDRVAGGSQELMLVAGYAGVGKSALVAEVHKPVTEKRGYFISGKFDQYQQNIPYTAFTQAFNQFAELLLTEPEMTLRQWRDKILAAVGSNGVVLTEVMPSLENVIGPQPAVPKLGGQESRNRFNLTFRNFVQAISTAEHPLVVFIDDWQWADLASLELLKVLLMGEKITHLLLMGAYRDNEVDRTHPFIMTLNDLTTAGAAVQTIELGNLRLEDVRQLIQESLSGSQTDSQALTELVYEKTQGNAFFTRQFLQNLYEENWLHFDFDTRRWGWDIAQITAQNITDNVVDLMAGKLKKLSPETADLLQLAACMGSEFDLQSLALIGQMSVPITLARLAEALTQGLVIPLDDYYKLPDTAAQARFSFLHDRVQQAAYTQIPAPKQQAVQLEIGRLVLANTPASELERRVFDIVQHYNQAGPLVTVETERQRLAELNMQAAGLAYEAAAFRSAQVYLEAALALMPADAWVSRYDWMLRLHSQLATIFSLTGDFEQLERVFQTTEARARTVVDTVQVRHAKIQGVLARGTYTEAIDLGLSLIEDLGVSINRNPSPEEALNYLRETAEWLTEDRIETLRYLPDASTEVGLILETAVLINGPVFNTNVYLSFVFVSRITRLCLEQGLASWAPVSIATFALLLSAALHDIPKARRLLSITMQLEERYPLDSLIPYLSVASGGFITHRYDHLKHTLPIFAEGVQKGLATGAFQFVGYCVWWYARRHLLSGAPLAEAETVSQQAVETCQKIQMQGFKNWCLLTYQVALNLQGKSEIPWVLKGDAYDEQEKLAVYLQANDFAEIVRIFFYKAWLHYLFDQSQESVNFFRETESYLPFAAGLYLTPLFYFYDTLANASVFDQQTEDGRLQILERINRNLEQLEVWVRFAPMNHQHKKDLMEAEKARLEGRHWQAVTCYEKAIQGARDNEFLHEEALAYELAAEFYLSRGLEEIARLYMTRAYDGYSRWQAWAKVQDLEKRHRRWVAKPARISAKESSTEHTGRWRSLDLESVVKASQAISGQIVLDELLKKLMEIVIENAGAQQGCLILEKDGQWIIEAEGTSDPKDVTTLQAIEVEESDAACPSIVRYVARSHESMVLADAAQKGLFVDDPYVKRNQTKSVLCTPLLNRGRLSGILYLENSLAADTFTPERIEVLELLAGQAAIALENARLYQQAQQEIAERKLVEAALRESEQRFRTIFDSVNDAIFVEDPATGDILDVNARMSMMYGYTREEALQIKIEDLSSGEPPYTQKDALVWMKKAATGEPQLFEWRAKDKDGRLFWVEVNMRRAVIEGQDRLLVAVRDITERKQAEEALHESAEQYRIITNTSMDGFAIVDVTGRLLDVNEAYSRMIGYSRDELLKMSVSDIEAIATPEEIQTQHQKTMAGSQLFESRHRRKDGRIIDVEVSMTFMHLSGQTLVFLRDITERKRAEEALQESEHRFRMLAEASFEGIALTEEGVIVDLNDQLAHMFGYARDGLIGKPVMEAVAPESRDLVAEAIRSGRLEPYEHLALRKDGTTFPVEVRARVAQTAGRQLRVSAVRDITERKRIEEALRESEARYRAIIESQVDLISRYLPDTTLTFVNDAYCQFYGKTREELIGHSYLFMIAPEFRELVRKEAENLAKDPRPLVGEYVNYRHDGKECWIQWVVQCISDENGRVVELQAVGRDITERKQAEVQLERALRETHVRYEISRALASAQTEEQVLDVLAEQSGLYPQAGVDIMILERGEDDELTLVSRRSSSFDSGLPQTPQGTRFPASQFPIVNLITPDTLFVSSDVFHDERVDEGTQALASQEGWTSLANVPITAGDSWLGVVVAASKQEGYFDEEKQHLYQTLAEQGAVALHAARLRETIRESQQRLSLLVQQSPLGVIEWNMDFEVVLWNPAAERIFGYTREEALGRHVDLIVSEAARPMVDQLWQALLAQKGGTYGTYENLTRDGRTITCEWFNAPLIGAGGQVIGVASLVQDITERKWAEEALRESEERYRLLAEAAHDLIFIINREGNVDYANSFATQQFGRLPEEIIGRSHAELFVSGDAGRQQLNLRQVFESGQPLYVENPTQFPDRRMWLGTWLVPIKDEAGQVKSILGVSRDVTERKQAEEEIRKLNEELEERVIERTTQLEAANKELEAFSYSVSHDLRAPLRAMSGFSRILLEDYASQVPIEAQDYLRRVHDNAQKMGQLIDDLLAFSRLGRQALQVQPVKLADLARQALAELQEEQAGRRVEVSIGELPPCQADPALLKQVLVNLLSNALKFTRVREVACIEVGCQEIEGEMVYFVRDNGVGFDMAYAGKLFGVFQRLHGADEYEGTGVGLAIVQRIIHRHGGRVWAEAEVGRGATFYFTLQAFPGQPPSPSGA